MQVGSFLQRFFVVCVRNEPAWKMGTRQQGAVIGWLAWNRRAGGLIPSSTYEQKRCPHPWSCTFPAQQGGLFECGFPFPPGSKAVQPASFCRRVLHANLPSRIRIGNFSLLLSFKSLWQLPILSESFHFPLIFSCWVISGGENTAQLSIWFSHSLLPPSFYLRLIFFCLQSGNPNGLTCKLWLFMVFDIS